MCFGPFQSGIASICGFFVAGLACKKGANELSLGTLIFTMMELIQCLQYIAIEYYTANKILTAIAYFQICCQPLAFALVYCGFSHSKEHKWLYRRTMYPLAVIVGIMLLANYRDLWPTFMHNIIIKGFTYEQPDCIENCHCEIFSGPETFTYLAKTRLFSWTHVAWRINLWKPGYLFGSMSLHGFATFAPPLIIEKRITPFMLLSFIGLVIGTAVVKDSNAKPPIWCLVHTPFLVLVALHSFRKKYQRMTTHGRPNREGGPPSK